MHSAHFKPSSLRKTVAVGCVRNQASEWCTSYFLAFYSLSKVFVERISEVAVSLLLVTVAELENNILLSILSILGLALVIRGSGQSFVFLCACQLSKVIRQGDDTLANAAWALSH